MKKLKLEALNVESFDVLSPLQEAVGTVQAHAPSAQPSLTCKVSCPNYTCEGATCALVIC